MQMKCGTCGKEWGIYLGNRTLDEIPISNLRCKNCHFTILDDKEILENEELGLKEIYEYGFTPCLDFLTQKYPKGVDLVFGKY